MGVKKYENYPDAYQISIIGNRIVNTENKDPVSFYELCDLKTKKPIDGKMHMIIAELKKVKTEDIEKMTATERWAAFFKWFKDKNKAEKLGKLIKSEEGLKMAESALKYVSKDETMRKMIIQRDMARRDWNHKLATYRDEGKAEGIEIGRTEMKIEHDREIALKSLSEGLEPSLISKLTNFAFEGDKSP
jgi:predicted transposase/invertase (TIGR01784 family)